MYESWPVRKGYLSPIQIANPRVRLHISTVSTESSLFAHIIYEPRHKKTCFALCEQQRRRSACASTQSDQHLCCSLCRWYNTCSCYVLNFNTLANFCSCAGRFESYMVTNPEDRFSGDEAQLWNKRKLQRARDLAPLDSCACLFEGSQPASY